MPTARNAKVSREAARAEQRLFSRARRAERDYGRMLVRIARQVGTLVRGFAPEGVVNDLPGLENALDRYSQLITPWAQAVGLRMLTDVARRDESVWNERGRIMGVHLRQEIEETDIGELMRERLDDQVALITSLPRKAGRRVHELTIEAMIDGSRASEIAQLILQTGKVTASRAKLIARTEVSRTATELTMARAEAVGSEGYIWTTAHDGNVRESHLKMEGKFVKWDEPPTLDGMVGHAGALPNCRCLPVPVLADETPGHFR